MDCDRGDIPPRRGGHHGLELQFVAVDAAWGQETQHVQRGAMGARHRQRFRQRGIARKVAGLDGEFDPGVVLVDDAAGAYVQMSDFGVAHLSRGQAHTQFGRVDQSVREVSPQPVPVGRIGEFDRIVRRRVAVAEAIEDDQEYRGDFGSGGGHWNRGNRPSWG